MTLYIDIENKKLVQSLTSDRAVSAPVFMQGDNEPLQIHLLEKGAEELFAEKPLTVGTDFLRVAIARFKGYPKLLTYASGYTLNEDDVAEIVLPLNTTAIEQAVQDNEYVSAYLEVEYSNTDGKIVTVLQTACRVANDLVDNAPAVELQEQFYDKIYTDAIFSKKSANLSDLADKPTARENLGVYGKSETYTKSESDAQEALNVKKADNLSDVPDKAVARTNLNIYSKDESDAQEALNLKKASNLGDLPDKAASRTNLNVYSKDETDTQEALNLKKASNLSDVANVSLARANLDVPKNRDLNAFSYSGIYTSSSLSALGNYGAGIGSDLDSNGKYTFLTTYLGKTNNFMLFSPYNSDYNVFYPNINGQSFSVGYQYSYDEETGYSDYIPVSFNMTKPFEYGDKLALTIDDGNFKLYKNLEVICEGTLPEGFTVSDPASMLSWNGLKKDLIYSKSIKLPLTTAEGVSSKLNYSIEDFVKGVYPPKNLLSSRFLESVSAYTSAYSRILNGMRLTGGSSIGGKYNALKFSINPMNYSVNRECALSSTNSIYTTGTQYRIKFNIYFPTDNPNIDKVQLKIGNYTPAGLGTIISKSDTIDNIGVITAKNEWQQIDITLQGNHAGVPKLCFYKGTRTNYSITTETTDAVYIRDYYFYGYQGIEGFFYGTPDSGIWKNFGCATCDLSYYDGYSFPDSGNKIYTFRQNIVSFTDGAYIYFDSFPTGFALSQVVLRFNSAIPDTSEAAEESARNIFQLYMNGTFAHSEQIPQVQEGVSYNIYPKFGGPQSFYSLEVYSMYSCNCGGTIDFIFTKVQ